MKSLPLIEKNVNELLHDTTKQYPDKIAMIYQNEQWTYCELDLLTNQLAAGLLASGVKKGDHIGLLSENSANAVCSFLAITKIGAVACMLNTSLKAKELAELCSISAISYMMIGSGYKDIKFYDEVQTLIQYHPVKSVFDIAKAPTSPYTTFNQLVHLGESNMDAFYQNEATILPHDNGMILYTSGTTGKIPKAVVSSYYQLVNGGRQKAFSLEADSTDVFCNVLQIFHIFCIDVNIMAAFSIGAALVLPDDLHTINILTAIEKYHCTILNCVPCRFQAMILRKDFDTFNVSSVRTGIVGGAYCSPEYFRQFEAAFGMTLLPGLGQTEAIAGIAIANLSDSLLTRCTTVGHFVAHCEGKIADSGDAHPLPVGETGEICIRGPLIMKGYYQRPDLTAEVIDEEGWFHTGDLGQLDKDGNIHYIGRTKEMINRGGEKIIPSEIENAINTFNEIDTCKVIGLPDPYYGETVCACILLKKGKYISCSQLMHYLRKNLADFKIPQKIVFLDYFPMNATGKIQLHELRKMAEDSENSLSA